MHLTQVKVHQELYGKADVPCELEENVSVNELLTSAKRTNDLKKSVISTFLTS